LGRPSSYTPELAALLCERIVESDYGLEQICQAEDMPSASTVYRWLREREEFRQDYAHARELQGHVQADRGLRDAITAEDAGLGRLKWDARRWHASKLAPKEYGDSVALRHQGADGGPIELDVSATAARIAALVAAARQRAADTPMLLEDGSTAAEAIEPKD